MARRDLEVQVRADVGAYQKAMSAAVSSTDQLGQAGLRIQKVGLGMSKLGDTLTRNVTLPLVAIGAVATKAALDFDKSFTTMQTLAGVSAGVVDHLKESVLDLAGTTGRAPQELAEALYFLQSSGLDSAQAMDALEVSAKASAAGLGATQNIANAVSSAMLGYAKSGLTAAEATDVLVATAREGKAEPAELASQMGRLIPIASELGITFGDVGGAIAALSTKGYDAEGATTALVNVMGKLLKPSQQAQELLEKVGLSTDTIRQSIAEKGLLATLEELRAKLGDAGFVKFLEDQQAVAGGLALLGGDLNKTKDIFEQVNNSVGATDNAFATWAKSMGAENAQAFASFQVALIRIGDVIAPIATDILNFASTIVEAFSSLPDGAQQAIIYFGLIAAAVGPLLSIGGRLITVVGTLVRLLPALAVPAGTVSGAFSGAAVSTTAFSTALAGLTKVTLVVGALVALRQVLQALDDDVQTANLSELENQLLKLGETGKVSGGTLRRVFEGLGGDMTNVDVRQFAKDLDQLDAGLAKLAARDPESAAAAFERITDAMREQGSSASEIRSKFDDYRAALADADTASKTSASSTAEIEAAMADLGLETENTKTELQEYSDQLKGMTDPLFAAMNAVTGNRDAQLGYQDAIGGVMEAQAALDEAIRNHGPNSAEAADATRGLEDAQRTLSDAQWSTVESAAEVDSALAALSDAVVNGDVDFDEFRSTLQQWVSQGFLTQEQADAAAGSVEGLAGAADEADQKRVEIPVGVPGAPESRVALTQVRDAAHDVPGSRNVHVSTSGTWSAIGELDALARKVNALSGANVRVSVGGGGGLILHEGGIVPGPRGQEVAAILQAGERVVSLAEMGRPYASPATWGGGGTSVASSVQQVTEVVQVVVDGAAVAEAVRRYKRNNGLDWRS